MNTQEMKFTWESGSVTVQVIKMSYLSLYITPHLGTGYVVVPMVTYQIMPYLKLELVTVEGWQASDPESAVLFIS